MRQRRHRPAIVPAFLRAQGRLHAIFERSDAGVTRVASLEEAGGYRMRFPRAHPAAGRDGGSRLESPREGAIINTGGGMAGGDRLSIRVEAREGADVMLTTPAAERIYRSTGPDTEVDVELRLAQGVRLAWLPQETILYSGARLRRRLTVEMHGSATLILAEATVFGRIAMGETPGKGLFADRWRIRRDGQLLHAEEISLDGPIAELLARPAIGDGARAMATMLMVSPWAEDRLDAARVALANARCECGASAWKGLLLGRFLAKEPGHLRADLVRFLLAATGGGPPRLWTAGRDASPAKTALAVEEAAASTPDWGSARKREIAVEPDPA